MESIAELLRGDSLPGHRRRRVGFPIQMSNSPPSLRFGAASHTKARGSARIQKGALVRPCFLSGPG
jgi:hypothetical protein